MTVQESTEAWLSDLVQLGKASPVPLKGQQARQPPWLRVKVRHTRAYRELRVYWMVLGLNTVCEDARCPNIWKC
ncbi:MAG: hypothetical protein R3C68_13495 [Myxococcota bacterium]